ncbi:MAG: HAD family hydrolase [Pararhizobium sp.]
MRPAAPGLVIFDCDGVLVDSEPISIGVLVEMIAEAGGTMSEDEAYDRFLGKSLASICEILEHEHDLSIQPIHLETMRRRLYGRFRSELKPVRGIREALEALAIPRCVASSSQVERIRLSLTVTGLIDRLGDHIFSSTMVDRGKPAPDLFLFAAENMGVPPHACLVIEDSLAGVAAARAAGMRVFGFTGASHAGRPKHLEAMRDLEPDLIFDDMKALPDLIAALRPTGK